MGRAFNGSLTGGSEQYLTTSPSAVYDNLAAFSFGGWIFPTADTITRGIIFTKAVTAAGTAKKLFYLSGAGGGLIGQGQIVGGILASGISVSIQTLTLSVWTHVAFTWDSTGDKKIRLYINGVEVSYAFQIASGVAADDSAQGYNFGNDTFDEGFTGTLSDFRIYNVALNGAQVATLAGGGNPAAANLVAEWLLCGVASPEPDSSGNGNDAVLVGDPNKGLNPPLVVGCGAGTPSSGFGGVGQSRWLNGARDIV